MNTNLNKKSLFTRENALLVIGFVLMAFVIYTSATSPLSPMLQRCLVLLPTIYITVLAKPFKSKAGKVIDGLIILGATAALGYLIVNWRDLAYKVSYEPKLAEVILGAILILLLLELARRCMGWPLVIIAACALLYARFGRYLPAAIAHKGYGIDRLISNQYITNVGIFGTMVGTLSTIIAPFVLFGSVLQLTGVGELMVDAAMLVARNSRGGPAKMAVLASGLFGMVSGSSTSNVMTTGCTTIPLMKDTGYEKDFAGAVEAAASTGGQIMPPVMGAAAFLMSYATGIPYITIATAAIIPALLYFISILFEVDFEARRLNLKPFEGAANKEQVKSVLGRCYMFLPFVLLVVLLLKNWSCAKAAFWAIVATLLLGCIRKETRLSLKMVKEISINFAKSMTTVSMACAVSGIVIGALNLTGATLRLTYAFVNLAGGRLLVLLFCVAILCIILGMGLPTPAAYSVAASFAAPALVQIGVSTLTSHLFVLYYASLSSITPPVAIAAYAAAGLSGGNPMKTGFTAWRLALVGFVVPFMFVYSTPLLIGEAVWHASLQAGITALIGTAFLSMSTIGFLKHKFTWPGRILLAAAALLLIYSGTWTDIAGIAIGAIIVLVHLRRKSSQAGYAT